MINCYIALGANLGNPAGQLQQAIAILRRHPNCRVHHCSSFYRSVAIGPGQQPDYVNAALALGTDLAPHSLLRLLQQIEADMGRQRLQRWAARTLDLDILLYGQAVISSTDLQVPHPRLCERNFVVIPLLEIAPELILPDGRALSEVAATLPQANCWRLPNP